MTETKHDAIFSFDADGVFLETSKREQLFYAIWPQFTELIQQFMQSSNGPLKNWRQRKTYQYLQKRTVQSDGIDAIKLLHKRAAELKKQTGIKIGIAVATERPSLVHDLIVKSLSESKVADLIDYYFENQFGGDHLSVKPKLAQELKNKGIIHGHLDDKFLISANLSAIGSYSYLIKNPYNKNYAGQRNLFVVSRATDAVEHFLEILKKSKMDLKT